MILYLPNIEKNTITKTKDNNVLYNKIISIDKITKKNNNV